MKIKRDFIYIDIFVIVFHSKFNFMSTTMLSQRTLKYNLNINYSCGQKF